MSTKVSTALLSHTYKPTFLSLRVLQSQCPPPNPARPPLPFLLPALAHDQLQLSSTRRTFSTTPSHLKKSGGKQSSKRPPPNLPSSKEDVDVHDLSAYNQAIAKAHEQLKAELARIKAGGAGRDLEALEGIRVQPEKGKGGLKLGEVAQVVPRGRNVVLLVGEKEHVKPITSALAQPPHNLNAQSSPTEPLTLTIPLPPITQESRQAAAQVAVQKGEVALFALREARGAHRKKLRALELGKLVGPDELRRAEKEMEKVNEGAVAEAKKTVEEGKRRVMGQ